MKSKKYILFFAGIFFLTNSFAQTKISLTGKVTDAKTGEALAGASVYFPDLRTGAACNNEGIYLISNISAGKYLVEVSHLGYSSIIETVEASSNAQKDFILNPSVVENEAVTVTGVSSATSTKRTSIPVNIVKKENMFNNVSTNLIDNLAKTPGVAQVTTGPGISKPFIRGLGYNRVVVVNDGIRQEGQQWGDEHGIEIDELNASRVELLKGPASLMYGSDALAGVVNIISILPAPEGHIKGNIFGAYQTNNRQRSLHADIGGNSNGFIWGLYGSYKAAADYKNKFDGYVFNSKFNEKDFGAYIGVNKSWGFTHLYVSKFDQHPGLVEGDRDDLTGRFLKLVNNGGVASEEIATDADFKSTTPYIPRQRIQHFKIAADNSFNIGKDRFTMVLGYQQNQRQEFGNVLDPGEKELFFDLGTVNYNLQYHLAEQKNWRTSIGINGMQQTNKNKGAEQLIPEYNLFDIGGFVYTRKTINKLTLSGGLRFDNRSIDSKELMDGPDLKFSAFKKNFSNLSGSAGLAYEASKIVTLKFNIARGFRAPNITELSANGVHEGSFQYIYGDVNLKSETSLQVDAGFIANSDHVSFQLNLFSNSIHNFIFLHKLASVNGGDSIINIAGDNFNAFSYGQHNATLYGAEFNLDIHPHPLDWLHIENTFSWVRGVLKQPEDGSKNIPFIPATRLINEIKVDFAKKGKAFKNWFVLAELDNTFAQNNPFTGFNTETKTAGFSLINAGIGGDISSKGKTLFSLFLAANNIADVAYQNHLSRLKYAPENLVTGRTGVFNMGRTFTVKLNIPLDFITKEK
ncbi:MAG TPA: TonB-dependent receptor [Chitinophagaceae bacterium]|nr:TonB-dependent receptor [Chitinophagaceae bacterium]